MAQPRSIPEEPVLGLLSSETRSGRMPSFEILVARAPDSIPLMKLILPIIGSIKQGDNATIVYRAAGELSGEYSRAKTTLMAAGWQSGSEDESEQVGFAPTDHSHHTYLCRGDDMLILQALLVRPDSGILKTHLRRAQGCHIGWTQYPTRTETPLPSLAPPTRAMTHTYNVNMPGVVGVYATSAYIIADMSTAAIMEHYGAQLRAKGWQAGDFTEATAVQKWRYAQDGKDWLATMVATRLPERRHIIELNVYNLTELSR
jgi:hypothetical protein